MRKYHTIELIFLLFVIWRLSLFAFLFVSQRTLPLQRDFIGGGRANYLTQPYVWSWVNFDGEHYLTIAREGYKPLTYFYFPVYPLLVRTVSLIWDTSPLHMVYIGLVISNVFFLAGLLLFYDLVLKEWGRRVALLSIVILLAMPTSFYFASFYTESLFLFLSVLSFWAARRQNWILAGLAASIASATRIVGLILLPALILEWWLQQKERPSKRLWTYMFPILLTPLGLIIYMFYLWRTTGDPLIFQHSIAIFGDQRSQSLVFIGQVFYRYLFKILPNLPLYWPAIFFTVLEFVAGAYFFVLIFLSFNKIRISYWVFLTLGYIIPTLSGSFSSMSRYILILFPGIVLTAIAVQKLPKPLQIVIFVLLYISLGVASALFFRGFWIA